MMAFCSPRRAALVAGVSWLVAATAAPIFGQPICTATTRCVDAAPASDAPPPKVLTAAAGGGRALQSSTSHTLGRGDVLIGAVDPDHEDDYLYRLPYGDDVSFPIIQGYGASLSHRGAEQYTLDFGMPIGTPVHAARDGVVVLVEDSHDRACWQEECGRLANYIVVLHRDGTTGEYFHLERASARVRVGEHVRSGQVLALSGNTGYSTAPHLHFGVYRAERDGRTQSLAVRFKTRLGTVGQPRSGAHYRNVVER